MLPQNLVFLDLETTGANPLHDRIIEIGLCEVADGQPDREWSTLVNPEKTFSPFIEQLTGIANGMVTDAPTFDEIAEELFDRLAGKVLVAHNARFDYGFLKNEFRRQGIAFQEKTLCTVKLSRTLFPEHRRHNLDALVERHGLGAQNRHRALGDARLIREFVQKIRDELPAETVDRAVRSQLKQPSLPPHLPEAQVGALPAGPGANCFCREEWSSTSARARYRPASSPPRRRPSGEQEMRLSQSAGSTHETARARGGAAPGQELLHPQRQQRPGPLFPGLAPAMAFHPRHLEGTWRQR
jgi:DNA polymerase-3 subunit epsilon